VTVFGASRPPLEVLQIATLDAARLANTDADLGSIEPGKKLTSVLVAGNPTVNITDVRQCTIVVKNGAERSTLRSAWNQTLESCDCAGHQDASPFGVSGS